MLRTVTIETDVRGLDMTMKGQKVTSVKHIQVGEEPLEYQKKAVVGLIVSKVR